MRYHSSDQILKVARSLKGKTVREISGDQASYNSQNKGSVGNLIEKFGFGIPNNSLSEPDFQPVGIELKVLPLKKTGGGWDVKERTKIGMIDYMEVVNETWETSHCRNKLNQILFVFYQHNSTDALDGKVVDYLLYSLEGRADDERLIYKDWSTVVAKIQLGLAHELSERDTRILGASTSGSSSEDVRAQPFSAEPAKRRAFSLKPSYTKVLWKEHCSRTIFDSITTLPEYLPGQDVASFLMSRVHSYEGQLLSDISVQLGVQIKGGKASNAGFIRAMLGFKKGKGHIREVMQAGITLRVIPVNPITGNLREAVSFAHQSLADILSEREFLDSALMGHLESILFVPVLRGPKSDDSDACLGRAFMWSPSAAELTVIEREWNMAKEQIRLIQSSGSKQRSTHQILPSKETSYIHVRPHGRNAEDLDRSVGTPVTKQSFWLNSSFVSSAFKGCLPL
jgi:DNA mismatch repair protein MutH